MKLKMKRLLGLVLSLVLILTMLPISSFADEGTTVYLEPGVWNVDGARFAVYTWNNSGNTWINMTDSDGDGVYECIIPTGYTDLNFCRMNGSTSTNDWNNKWNQTNDLSTASGKNYCKITAFVDNNNSTCEWSTYTPPVTVTIPADTVIYFDASANTSWPQASATFGFRLNEDETSMVMMEQITGTNIYKGTVNVDASKIQFCRVDPENQAVAGIWNHTNWLDGESDKNLFSLDSGVTWTGATGTWSTYTETPSVTYADFAGKTIYVSGATSAPTVKLTDGTTVTMTAVSGETNVYTYTFSGTVVSGTTFSISGTDVSGESTVGTSTPCYNVSTGKWETLTLSSNAITIMLNPGTLTSLRFTKADNPTSDGTITNGSFVYDCDTYDGFQVGWGFDQTGNYTPVIEEDEILTEAEKNPGAALILNVSTTFADGPNGHIAYTWSVVGVNSDNSLDIPTKDFTKESGSYYIKATFYDYYSDIEMDGTLRSSLSQDGPTKVQAMWFNRAVSSYFTLNPIDNTVIEKITKKPLYFGEFTESGDISKCLLDFEYYYNNGKGVDSTGAKQGLVDSELVNNQIQMGGVDLPYFNESFIRGGNIYGANIGYVYSDVEFPFKMVDGYWTFDSSNSAHALRMTETASGSGDYYLDRAEEAVKGTNSDGQESVGFFPFNDSTDKKNQLNYAFGARLDIPFTMTSDGKIYSGASDTEGKDIVYNFSGDDDVWVFIDGVLVLDIGGDHGRVNGSINFATGKVTVGTITTGTNDAITKYVQDLSSNETHTLTMFYMERGLWESNMKITFNFPEFNAFAVDKEVNTDKVDALFKDTLRENLSSFDVIIKNLATRGNDKSATGTTIVDPLTYNAVESSPASTIKTEGTPAESGIQTDTSNKSGRADVYMVRYHAQLPETDDADGHRIIIKPESGDTFNADECTDYLQFDMYNEGLGSVGVPYVYMKDASDNVIEGWAKGSYAYNGNYNTLTRNTWVTVKVDLQNLKGESTFNFSEIKEIRVGYWDSGYTYVDNFEFYKENTVTEETYEFKISQSQVPTYGSIAANGLVYPVGAIYEREDGTKYIVGSTGIITLNDGETALFKDQFRIGSYIYLEEKADQGYFTTTWELSENGVPYKTGSGLVIDDNRTESSSYASESGMTYNTAVSEPTVGTLLYRSNSDPDDIVTPTNLSATFINTVNTGSLTITKAVTGTLDSATAYEFTIVFSNILGQGGTKIDPITFTLKDGETKTFTGIPVGTDYTITETTSSEYAVSNIAQADGGDDIITMDVANQSCSGTIALGADNKTDTITFTNAKAPEIINKVFYVESGVVIDLPMGVTVTSADAKAMPKAATLNAPIVLSANGTGVTFDVSGSEQSIPNEAYSFNYTGEDSSKNPVKGSVIVYTFKATNKVYVFDYGLESDLAATNGTDGLFEGGVFYNDYATDDNATTAVLGGVEGVDNEQTTITYKDTVAINSDGSSNGAVTFKPVAFMSQAENYTYTVNIAKDHDEFVAEDPETGTAVSGTIKVMPASTVYYEDNFNCTTEGDSTAKIIYSGDCETSDTEPTITQSNDQSEQYGHDAAYSSGTEYSADSAATMSASATAQFTFSGTGFDIISRTNSTTASIMVQVYYGDAVDADALYKTIPLITYYDNGDLYQVPVIHETGYDYGQYTVVITVMSFNGEGINFYLDAIRIYNPMDADNYEGSLDEDYIASEYWIYDQEIRPLILNTTAVDSEGFDNAVICTYVTGTGGNVLISNGSTYVEILKGTTGDVTDPSTSDLEKYWQWGPNNELYLEAGNAVAFLIAVEDYEEMVEAYGEEAMTLQVAAKVENGSSVSLRAIDVNGTAYPVYTVEDGEEIEVNSISTATTMYYHVPINDDMIMTNEDGEEFYQIIIANTSSSTDSRVSLTNIKSTVNPELFVVPELAQETLALALYEAFSTDEGDIYKAAFTAKVKAGKTATLQVYTSLDAESLIIYDAEGNEVDVAWTQSSRTMTVDGQRQKVTLWKAKITAPDTKGSYDYTVSAQMGDKEVRDIETATLTVR